jgi:hypothetical protein
MSRKSLKYHLVEGPITYGFTLHLRIRDHTTWFWRCVGTAFGHFLLGSHNFMVMACVWGGPMSSPKHQELGHLHIAVPLKPTVSLWGTTWPTLIPSISNCIKRSTQKKCVKFGHNCDSLEVNYEKHEALMTLDKGRFQLGVKRINLLQIKLLVLFSILRIVSTCFLFAKT